MTWIEAKTTKHPKSCDKCDCYGFTGCSACTLPDENGRCDKFTLRVYNHEDLDTFSEVKDLGK